MLVNVCSYSYKKIPEDAFIVDTTSRSKHIEWVRLSPFFLGPVDLYSGFTSKNVENAWQFSKVYPDQVDKDGYPLPEYFDWATKGWNETWAHRYPKGKGTKPLYSLWEDKKLGYTEARKVIYAPLYSKAVEDTAAFKALKRHYSEGCNIWLRDFDGYDFRSLGMSYEDVINNPNKKMGHAFVLAMLLEDKRAWL